MARFIDNEVFPWRVVFTRTLTDKMPPWARAALLSGELIESVRHDHARLVTLLRHICQRQAWEVCQLDNFEKIIKGREAEAIAALEQAAKYYRAGQRQRVE